MPSRLLLDVRAHLQPAVERPHDLHPTGRGIHLNFEMKEPGSSWEMRSVDMDFHYRSIFSDGAS